MLKQRNVGVALLAAFLMTIGFVSSVRADDKKPDATGAWKWTVMGRNNQTRDFTLKLKQDGDKLTGSVSGFGNADIDITDGTIKDGDVSFKVVRKGQNGQERTTTYTGKLDGDSIKGKSEMGGNQTRSRDWEAKRSKD